jgi:hypothetical protein
MAVDLFSLLRDWDPALKVLGALAAPGGLWFWFDKYRNRIRIKVLCARFTQGDTSGRGLTLVVENVGSSSTSAGPNLTVTGRDKYRHVLKLNYRLIVKHVKLPPLDTVEIHATHNDPGSETLFWAWYFVIKVPLSRGRAIKVRCRNAKFEQLGFWHFHWERFRFICLKHTPGMD